MTLESEIDIVANKLRLEKRDNGGHNDTICNAQSLIFDLRNQRNLHRKRREIASALLVNGSPSRDLGKKNSHVNVEYFDGILNANQSP